MRFRSAIALLGLVLGAAAGTTGELQVELRPASTTIDFTLKATMHTVHGTAALERGAFRHANAQADAADLIRQHLDDPPRHATSRSGSHARTRQRRD